MNSLPYYTRLNEIVDNKAIDDAVNEIRAIVPNYDSEWVVAHTTTFYEPERAFVITNVPLNKFLHKVMPLAFGCDNVDNLEIDFELGDMDDEIRHLTTVATAIRENEFWDEFLLVPGLTVTRCFKTFELTSENWRNSYRISKDNLIDIVDNLIAIAEHAIKRYTDDA
jgi:hypothetical protein